MGGGPRVVVSTAAFHARVRGSVPGLGGFKETKMFLPHPRVKVSIVGSLRDREVACSASDRQGSKFESCVWRTVSSQSSHHPQEVLLAQFSLYVHKSGLKPDSFHFISFTMQGFWQMPMDLCPRIKYGKWFRIFTLSTLKIQWKKLLSLLRFVFDPLIHADTPDGNWFYLFFATIMYSSSISAWNYTPFNIQGDELLPRDGVK